MFRAGVLAFVLVFDVRCLCYYILYIILLYIIYYTIISYTIHSFSPILSPLPSLPSQSISSSPLLSPPLTIIYLPSLPPNPILLFLFPFLSSPIYPSSLLIPSSPPLLFLYSHPLIHSIRVGIWISLFIFSPHPRQSDPSCFIGVDG